MIIAVFTGARKWNDHLAVNQAFERAEVLMGGIHYVVTGDQRGLDRIAYEVACARGYRGRVVPVHAFWKEDGNGAGNVRNGQMINVAYGLAEALSWSWAANYGRQNVPAPERFICGFAFPDADSVGTWNCVDDMIAKGIKYELRGTADRRPQR